ncbi:hypothetical protein ACFHW0_26095 [Micromonospora sp. LOL_025]|uniref:hypothetical protein n=1 Tax=Micromonospora sp. LOL_025 TaxID=3345413 RepID=UPI003A86062F
MQDEIDQVVVQERREVVGGKLRELVDAVPTAVEQLAEVQAYQVAETGTQVGGRYRPERLLVVFVRVLAVLDPPAGRGGPSDRRRRGRAGRCGTGR